MASKRKAKNRLARLQRQAERLEAKRRIVEAEKVIESLDDSCVKPVVEEGETISVKLPTGEWAQVLLSSAMESVETWRRKDYEEDVERAVSDVFDPNESETWNEDRVVENCDISGYGRAIQILEFSRYGDDEIERLASEAFRHDASMELRRRIDESKCGECGRFAELTSFEGEKLCESCLDDKQTNAWDAADADALRDSDALDAEGA